MQEANALLRARLLVAAALVLLVAACSSGASGHDEMSGAELYKAYCAACHGADGRGTTMNLGPSYAGLAQYWDARRLLEYIADPQAFAATDPRLGERPMTAIAADVPLGARQRLVEHALSLMD